jgi:hypothetical protein
MGESMLNGVKRRQVEVTCSGCGAGVGAEHAFCPRCGNKLQDSAHQDTAVLDHLGMLFDVSEREPAGAPSDQVLADPAQTRVTRGGRRGALIAGLLALLLVLTSAGVWAWSYWRDAPARSALDSTQVEFAAAVETLSGASSLDELHDGASTLDALEGELEAARESVSSGSDLSVAARGLLGARQDLATAGAALTTVTDDDFSTWTDVRADLVEAVDGYEAARQELHTVDGERAELAALPPGLVSNLEVAVGGAMLTSSGESFADLLGSLEGSQDTADLRAVGTDARSLGAGIGTVLDGFDAGTDEDEQLTGYVELSAALAGLSAIDAGHLDEWTEVRSQITQSLASVTLAEGSLNGSATTALEHVNGLVARAQERLRAWRADYEAAAEAKRDAMSGLASYRAEMTTQLDRYGELRGSLSDWIDRVEDPSTTVTYDEGYDVLWRAEMDRQEVRDAMSKLSVPAELSTSHNELVSVLDDGIAAVSAAYEGLLDADFCSFGCYYKDTPGWQRFRSESSRITDAFGVAVEQWESELVQAEAAAENTRLPKQPAV